LLNNIYLTTQLRTAVSFFKRLQVLHMLQKFPSSTYGAHIFITIFTVPCHELVKSILQFHAVRWILV